MAELVWTQAEIDSIKAAILALSTGALVARVRFGDREVQYHAVDLKTLKELLAVAVSAETSGPSYRLAAHSKGA